MFKAFSYMEKIELHQVSFNMEKIVLGQCIEISMQYEDDTCIDIPVCL